MARFWEILLVATRLGLTSFGGPVAHIGYFRDEYVVRRKWLDEGTFAELIALCQFLPGPASSQLGMAVGIKRGRAAGRVRGVAGIHAAVRIGADPCSRMACRNLGRRGERRLASRTQDRRRCRRCVRAVGDGADTCAGPDAHHHGRRCGGSHSLVGRNSGAIVGDRRRGGVGPDRILRPPEQRADAVTGVSGGTRAALVLLIAFVALLALLPVASRVTESLPLDVFDSFYRSGSLVFGGGHVVLPLIEAEVVPPGWVTSDEFLAGYGAAQAVPGPLFTFAAFLGASVEGLTPRWGGGLLALAAIFAPSFLLVPGVLPFWERVRGVARVRQALMGVNAAVVGLLLAALYDPLWISAIGRPADFAVAAGAFALLAFWKAPPWLVVVVTGYGRRGGGAAALGRHAIP